jgi:adenine deaminase
MKKDSILVQGQLVDIHNRAIFPAEITIENQTIVKIRSVASAPAIFILPGFVDAHVHIESSMLAPSEFAPMALEHGTLATVSDPHEIANVLGEDGVRWMAENGKSAPLHFHFGAPSCVPATTFETAGDVIDAAGIRRLLEDKTCHYLAEMMNWPGVIFQDPMVMEKLALSKELGVPIDGHAPGLRGQQAKDYFAAGIETDHECFTLEEAMEKAAMGVKILIREGSAARNFEALIDLFRHYPGQVMFCSDDKHPDDLILGHINLLVSRALAKGFDLFDVLRAASLHPVEHYRLPIGLLREGDPADFILVESLQKMNVLQTWRKGEIVFDKGRFRWEPEPVSDLPNRFFAHFPEASQYQVASEQKERSWVNVMDAIEGQLITKGRIAEMEVKQGCILADPARDILHLTVVNRYRNEKPANAFISGFGLKNAAIASSVAHDSHNIVAVGTHTHLLKKAVDAVMEAGGGISIATENGVEVLSLPIAGLMSPEKGEVVGHRYEALTQLARQQSSTPKAPYMLLSFMALLVIPELKLSDLGLFDGLKFAFTDLEVTGK